ncbi:T5orf172 domain-containing protein [Dichotomopilus funicola]|uniref:T5orf172 domain-containing protein n=1 Tax=Dichotomopilus funicola TaxID=1934379 RepID=A0AAN6ZJL0_9PEZI|nr:T5orf172 domain-containing protein [Dichotomopilus funicola]
MSPEPKRKPKTQRLAGEDEPAILSSPSERRTGQQANPLKPLTPKRISPTVTVLQDAAIDIASPEVESPSVSVAKRRASAPPKPSTPSSRPKPRLHFARPAAETRSANNPFPLRIPQLFRTTDVAIENLIRRSAVASKPGSSAFVYVLTAVHEGEQIVKIGHTTKFVERRVRQIEHQCRCIRFDRVSIDMPHPQIERYYTTVEKLAHAELQHLQYTFNCCCGQRHKEYFKVDRDIACHVVKRWVRFCKAGPWRSTLGEKLEVKHHWDDRLMGWRKGLDDPPKDLAALLGRWDRFVYVHWLEWVWYDVRVGSGWLVRFWREALAILACMLFKFRFGDRGWLAGLAEVIILMVLAKLLGFRSVVANGLLESLWEMVWSVTPMVLPAPSSHYSWEVVGSGISAECADKDEDDVDEDDIDGRADATVEDDTDDKGIGGGGNDRNQAQDNVEDGARDAEEWYQDVASGVQQLKNKGTKEGNGDNVHGDKKDEEVKGAGNGEAVDVELTQLSLVPS